MTDSRRSDPESDQDSDSQVFQLSSPNDNPSPPHESISTELTDNSKPLPSEITSNVDPDPDRKMSSYKTVANPDLVSDQEVENHDAGTHHPETSHIATDPTNSPKSLDPPVAEPVQETVVLSSFTDFNLPDNLIESVGALGWKQPTPVQSATYLQLAEGGDLLVQSQTGTGKTGAFCLPWLAKRYVDADPKISGIQLLILVPTRELAKQVSQELISLAQRSNLIVSAIYGGTPMLPQLEQLKKGIHAVIGTPGRVLDHLRRRSLNLSKIATVVLDECDEMLSMGFLEDIRTILDACPQSRQTCLFSATIPDDISRIAGRYLKSPKRIELSSDRISAKQIEHAYYVASSSVKTRDLVDVIVVEDPSFAIVFCNTREETRIVASVLQREGFAAESLSSDLPQSARERVLAKMRSHKLRFLVATDIAARGIDISHVSHVFNFSFPSSAETYVHRTGRTGRAGRAGQAISLVGHQEIGDFNLLTKHYPDLIFNQRQLPASEDLDSTRKEEKLDALSRQYSIPVSPEWVQLARNLIADPRSDRIVAYLLERISQSNLGNEKTPDSPKLDNEAEATTSHSAPRHSHRNRRDSGSDEGRPRERRRTRGSTERDGSNKGSNKGSNRGYTSDAKLSPNRSEYNENRVGEQTEERESPTGFSDSNDTDTKHHSRQRLRSSTEQPRETEPLERHSKPRRPYNPNQSSDIQLDSSEKIKPDVGQDQGQIDPEKLSEDQSNPSFSRIEENPGDDLPETSLDNTSAIGRSRRRRRRRGRDRGSKDSPPNVITESETPSIDSQALIADDDPNKLSSSSDEVITESESTDALDRGRRRSRNGRRRRSRKPESKSESIGSSSEGTPQATDSQSKIVIEIDDQELEIVRSEFGEFDELSELTVKGRRRAFIDELKDRDDVSIEDLSQIDAQEDTSEDNAPELSDCDTAEQNKNLDRYPARNDNLAPSNRAVSEATFAPKSMPLADSQLHRSDESPDQRVSGTDIVTDTKESSERSEDSDPISEGRLGQKKRRRRRRSRRNLAPTTPEITAPPHKDFWEEWSLRFSWQDFVKEEDKIGDVQHADQSQRMPRNEGSVEDNASDRGRPTRSRSRSNASFEPTRLDDSAYEKKSHCFVRIRLNIGRRQGYKSADIRALVQDKCGLAGRDIRDLTVRTTSTFFQTAEDSSSKAIELLHGIQIGEIRLEATIAAENIDDNGSDRTGDSTSVNDAAVRPESNPEQLDQFQRETQTEPLAEQEQDNNPTEWMDSAQSPLENEKQGGKESNTPAFDSLDDQSGSDSRSESALMTQTEADVP